MLIENQLIEVKVIGKTLSHYRALGYNVNMFDVIMVPPNHLTTGSHSSVGIICDICGKEIDRPYKKYLQYHAAGYDTCNQCNRIKRKNTCIEKYGVSNPMLVPEIQEKLKKTIIGVYGVENISQSEEIKKRRKRLLRNVLELRTLCS